MSSAPVSTSDVATTEADSGERERERSEDKWSIPLAAAEQGRRGGGANEKSKDEKGACVCIRRKGNKKHR